MAPLALSLSPLSRPGKLPAMAAPAGETVSWRSDILRAVAAPTKPYRIVMVCRTSVSTTSFSGRSLEPARPPQP
eukprot:5753572-Alexandrium_andersonii.AAC.1